MNNGLNGSKAKQASNSKNVDYKITIGAIIILTIILASWGPSIQKNQQDGQIAKTTMDLSYDAPDIEPFLDFSREAKESEIIEPTIIEPEYQWLDFEITGYCSCSKCCDNSQGITRSGEKVQKDVTIAADWDVLPNGTKVYIESLGYRIVQDTGLAIHGNRIDVYFESHQAALDFGRQQLKVRIIDEN